MRVAVISVSNDFISGRETADKKIHVLTKKLIENGFDVAFNIVLPAIAEEIKQAVEYVKNSVNNCFVMGDVEEFKNYAESVTGFECGNIVVIDGVEFAVMSEFNDKDFNHILPLLNANSKIVYNTFIIKTFGLSESEVSALIKDYLKNKNRINILLYPSLMECDVYIRYNGKMAKMAVDEVIAGIMNCLSDYIYACNECSLSERAFELIKQRDVSIAFAESFTGGMLTSEIVKFPGASQYLFEGLVSYSNDSKIARLGVEEQIISKFGAVSIETVYEMAASMLMSYPVDLVVATSGNAGPSSEKPDEAGLCYIAVGDRSAIHVFSYRFSGTREENMMCGAKCGLYHIIKKLKSNDMYGL